MKAIVQSEYGPPDTVLSLQDIDKPELGDDDVRVGGHAASIHIGDWLVMTNALFLLRMATGLLRPKHRVPGMDISGTVEAVGGEVKSHQPGDEVFGWCTGAFGENKEETIFSELAVSHSGEEQR